MAGSLLACGSSSATDPAGEGPWVAGYIAIAAGSYRSCAVTYAGDIACWGRGVPAMDGQAADSAEVALAPRLVTRDGGYAEVAVGDGHNCATTVSGGIECWGHGSQGQVGNGQLEYVPSATPAIHPAVFTSVSVGAHHSCAVSTEMAGLCWGWNAAGQLGRGDLNGLGYPGGVGGGHRFASLDAGQRHTCGLDLDGVAHCWGRGESGQVGDIETERRLFPTPVATDLTFRDISAGHEHSCAVGVDGAAYCWGRGLEGQLGDGSLASSSLPVPVAGALQFSAIAAGDLHSCALTTDGEAYCWGHNHHGRLGNDGSSIPYPTPQPVAGELEFIAIAVGQLHSCGLTTSGQTYCWGFGGFGQLGGGTAAASPVPMPIAAPTY